MARNLNTQMVRAMSALTLLAFAVMYFGWVFYYTCVYAWLYPDADYSEKWFVSDFIVLGTIIAVGLIAALILGWRLALTIVRPLKSVADAARLIASGDFSTRAETIQTSFGEADSLIDDFNTMASRLEHTEAELKYSNSAIAHELRTPLTILRGRLQGLSDGVFKPTPELYGRLIAHVDDLTRIVEDLRTLGLSNAGKLELKLDEVDLATEGANAVSSMEQELANAGITVERDLGHAVVLADKSRVRQTLFALLDNARRYAPGSKVVVETRRTSDRAIIRCTDDGPGLPNGLEERAFERFWRADESRARASGGSGLGLPIVRAIALAHGGDARIVTTSGKGMSIEIWLPAANLA